MKSLTLLFVVVLLAVALPKQVHAQESDVSFQVFYDELSPYGQWVDYPNYGYVWIPDAGSNFVPYSTKGYWVFTDYGWTWVSNYNWGWAPFHYGRWDYDTNYGWFWVPDIEWGPAWVIWRRANGYYGWSPMGPGMSIALSFERGYNKSRDHWIFVRDRYIGNNDIQRHYIKQTFQARIIKNSKILNNSFIDNGRKATYVSGPAREDVQKAIGRSVIPVAVMENNKPGQEMRNGQLEIYRPKVISNNNNTQKPAPKKIVNLKEVKRPTHGNTPKRPRNIQLEQQQKANPAQNERNIQQLNTVTPQKPKKANPDRKKDEKPQPKSVDQLENPNKETPKRSDME